MRQLSTSIQAATHGGLCVINLGVRGYRSRRVLAPGAYSEWCEPEHREALGKALEDCKVLERRLTKAGIQEAIRQLKPAAILRGTKSDLGTYLAVLLIDVWFPVRDVEVEVGR